MVIHASEPGVGIGTAMMERMIEIARGMPPEPEGRERAAAATQEPDRNARNACDTRPSAHILWLVTTNDNVDAIRFYQHRGFKLSTLRPGVVEEARRDLKPDIPEVGNYGIPMRDELEFVRDL